MDKIDWHGDSLGESEVVLGDVVVAVVCEFEAKENADALAHFAPHRHHIQVDVVSVLRVPRRVNHIHPHERSLKVEEPHVEVLNHFGLRASRLLLPVPVCSRSQSLNVEIRLTRVLVVVRVAILLQQANSTGPVASFHLFQE